MLGKKKKKNQQRFSKISNEQLENINQNHPGTKKDYHNNCHNNYIQHSQDTRAKRESLKVATFDGLYNVETIYTYI